MKETAQIKDPRRGWTSASNAEYDELCAARHLAQLAIPDEPAEPDADRDTGKLIHDGLASNDPSKLSVSARETFDAIQKMEALEVERFFPGIPVTTLTVIREERMWVRFRGTSDNKEYAHSGQPDVVYIHGSAAGGGRALILEYKTLRGDHPESSRNSQLRDQAVLVRGRFGTVREVGVAVLQPMVSHHPQVCIYDYDALIESERRLFNRVISSHNESAIATAGDRQCRFCKAKFNCAAYNTWSGSQVPGMLSIMEVPVAHWTPQQRAIFMDRRDAAQRWLDECSTEMKRLLAIDPDAVPGWYISKGRVVEKVKDPQKVFERFIGLGGKPEVFMRCVDIGKTKLREAVSEVTGARGKALDGAMGTVLDGCVDTVQYSGSLTRKKE